MMPSSRKEGGIFLEAPADIHFAVQRNSVLFFLRGLS